MTTFRQIQANRRNALNSTGPNTTEGKQKSRCNAVRHGLTAETVIGALENVDDYKVFEAAIIADYDAQSAVERELVLRLASVLWRLRRATTMETGLFDLQFARLRETAQARQGQPKAGPVVVGSDAWVDTISASSQHSNSGLRPVELHSEQNSANPPAEIAQCFLGLADLPNYALDRLSRYEAALWRQTAQIVFTLDGLGRRRPQDRAPPSYFRGRHGPPFGE